MGMNDDQLTPAEHAAVRQRLLAGARRIEPVGRHRNAWIAGSVAVVLILALAGGAVGIGGLLGTAQPQPATTATASPSPSPTPTVTPTPSISPTPSLTPTEPPPPVPAVAFDGDCSRVLTDEEASEAAGEPVSLFGRSTDSSLYPETTASTNLLGGIQCAWRGEEIGIGSFVSVTVLDARAVPADVTDKYSASVCTGLSAVCETVRVVGDAWIGATVPRTVSDLGSPTEDELQSIDNALAFVIDAVSSRLPETSTVAVPRQSSWWAPGSCEAQRAAVDRAAGGSMEARFPGDFVPEGLTWDAMVAAGVIQWCPWYRYSDTGRGPLFQIYSQPGAAAPDADYLERARLTPVEVDGADSAWIAYSETYPDEGMVVAVRGDNRLTVTFSGTTEDGLRAMVAELLQAAG
ncbi:hypothetical protein CVS47_00981 [Microbacterium lemovicicum]|uniref:DUF3558 domain-containing protein n=2 Tax=Microbacterium lemovicicum TaxID=1072463 RepID=A0A3S9W8H1_9MICO|nr:hypothetical protein [Microbacterium lemovicicum]AZS36380.1 hypothetical protein CVS47_00981 [Microbacterium lemovicicum]